MKIKTYPLQFTEEKLDEIRKIAESNNMTIKDFMLAAIDEKMKEEK